MNQYLGTFLGLSLLGLPLFLLILLEKCVDLRSYRKLGMTGKLAFTNALTRVLSLEILILVISQLLNALAACLPFTNDNPIMIFIILFFPPLPILSLILMYLLERKSIREASQKHSFKTKLFITDLILDLVFHASYHIVMVWSILAEIQKLGSGGNGLIGAIILFILFALLKLLIQHELVKLTRYDEKNETAPRYQFRLKN